MEVMWVMAMRQCGKRIAATHSMTNEGERGPRTPDERADSRRRKVQPEHRRCILCWKRQARWQCSADLPLPILP
eukprot:6168817-Pleurochrysis_carterae.AAC.1